MVFPTSVRVSQNTPLVATASLLVIGTSWLPCRISLGRNCALSDCGASDSRLTESSVSKSPCSRSSTSTEASFQETTSIQGDSSRSARRGLLKHVCVILSHLTWAVWHE
jgi:hypothetical protein